MLSLGLLGYDIAEPVTPLASGLAVVTLGLVLARTLVTVKDLRNAHTSHREARTDEMTGLANRRAFMEVLDKALFGLDAVNVLMIDLDGFKEVNDSLGHPAGDALLSRVADRFVGTLPRGVVLARLGGDEFGAIDPGPEGDGLAQRLLATLQAPFIMDGVTVRIGASIGISRYPDDGATRIELLRAADVAMYQAKRTRLGPVRYAPTDDPHSRERLVLIEELHLAIGNRTLDLHYQPMIDVRSGSVVGIEALVRWPHPTRGLLAPDQFLPLAEQSGMITRLTNAVLDLAVAQMAELRREGHDLKLSVNISAHDLVDEGLSEYVVKTLAQHEIAAASLTLEITETALAGDPDRAWRTVEQLRAAGVRISIDDFGVGYSSLSQILDLPFDELKVDRSFVSSAGGMKAVAILNATTELGRALGVDVVAEGVENDIAMAAVVGARADLAQGYFISRPLTGAALRAYLLGLANPALEPTPPESHAEPVVEPA